MLPLLSPLSPRALADFHRVFQQLDPPPAPPPAPAPPALPPVPPVEPPAPPPPPPNEPRTFDEEYVKKLRAENADWRTKFQQQKTLSDTQLREIAKALGLEDGEPDPAKLQAELTKTQQQNRDLRIGNALEAAARKHGADTDLLVPYLKGSNALDHLDPSSDTFSKDVSEAVQKLVEKNPKLKASQVPPRSGGEFPGGNNVAQQLTREQLKGMTPEAIDAARLAGQLDHIMGRS